MMDRIEHVKGRFESLLLTYGNISNQELAKYDFTGLAQELLDAVNTEITGYFRNDGKLHKVILGALQSQVNVHGDIGQESLSSTARRILAQIKGAIKTNQIYPLAKAEPLIRADQKRIDEEDFTKRFNPDYLDLQRGVETGRELEREKVLKEVLEKLNIRDVGGERPEWAMCDKHYLEYKDQLKSGIKS